MKLGGFEQTECKIKASLVKIPEEGLKNFMKEYFPMIRVVTLVSKLSFRENLLRLYIS